MLQKLQLDPDLTLESAKTMVRQLKAVREQQVQLRTGFQEEGLPVEESAIQVQVCVSKESEDIHQKHSQQGPSLQPATSVQGVTRDHTPDSVAQPEKPNVTAVKRKDTTSPSVFPTYQRSLNIAQPS